MITLYQMARSLGLPNASPACMKLEGWLRMAKLPHRVALPDLTRAPKGKLPFIEDEGLLLGDSNLILEHLRARHGVDLDAHLDPVERATSLAFRRMLDENFYWVLIEVRWRNPEAWGMVRAGIAATLPEALPLATRVELVDGQLRPAILAQLHGQGMGRHTAAEIHAIGIADMRAVSDFLGDGPYVFGDRPSALDAAVYAYVANMVEPPLANPVKDWILARENLVEHAARMKAELFPEL